MRLKEIIKSVGAVKVISNELDFEVSGISSNSQDVKDNFVFVAIKGNQQDGNKFIAEAIARGAKAVITSGKNPKELNAAAKHTSLISVKDTRSALAKLAAKFYGNPTSKIKTVGITGTNGKTTTTYLIEAILKKASIIPAVIGTINNRFKEKVLASKNTTPGPIELQSMLAEMLNEGVDYAIMEVSSHALEQARTECINFHSAIFTNLTQDHLDYHKTIENYFQSKAKLFRGLGEESFAVINEDDKYARRLKKLTKASIITYAIENDASLTAKNIRFSCSHTEFRLKSRQAETDFKSRLIGRHNVYNILAACAWASEEGFDIGLIKRAVEDFSFVPGRLERINSGRDFSVFVDYAHTEDALRNIIESVRQLCRKRVIVVFGCGGDRDKDKRPKMGRIVSELSNFAIITNDNPRSEEPKEIFNDIRRGIRKTNYCVIPERAEAIRKSLSLAKAGDVVLVAGKGHENYQIIKDRIMPFSDRQVIKECLKSMNY